MNKTLLGSFAQLFRPQLPSWACEFTERRFVVAGVSSGRRRIAGKSSSSIPAGLVTGSLSEKNLSDPQAVLEVVRQGLTEAGFRGSEIGVVIPDDSARVAFLSAENLPARQLERETFVRWKLKKNVPFDVDDAQVAIKVIGERPNRAHPGTAPGPGHAADGVDLLVALSPRAVIEEYVSLMEQMDIHAGFVLPSTLAAMNLVGHSDGDTLFVKLAPGCITTTVVQQNRIRFYRRVAEAPIYDAVYPTIMYYEDKLAGAGIQRGVVCSDGPDGEQVITQLHKKLNISAEQLAPQGVEDVFKPALGAVGLAWANSI